MIRCTEKKCKLFNEKKACRNRNQWGICKLDKKEFSVLAVDEMTEVTDDLAVDEMTEVIAGGEIPEVTEKSETETGDGKNE